MYKLTMSSTIITNSKGTAFVRNDSKYFRFCSSKYVYHSYYSPYNPLYTKS